MLFSTVEAGDSLSIIEKKTGVPMETLQNLNGIVLQLNELSPGLQLVTGFEGLAPVLYTVQMGDTVQEIADKARISIEDFVTLNRIGVSAPNMQTPLSVPQYVLKPGMRVIIGLENKTTNNSEGID